MFRRQQLDLENSKVVHVLRGGTLQTLHPRELVVGDVLRFSVGDILAADGLLLSGEGIRVDESSLTGESGLVEKSAEERPFLLSGTSVISGQGRMLVVAVGSWSMRGFILDAVLAPAKSRRDDDVVVAAAGSVFDQTSFTLSSLSALHKARLN